VGPRGRPTIPLPHLGPKRRPDERMPGEVRPRFGAAGVCAICLSERRNRNPQDLRRLSFQFNIEREACHIFASSYSAVGAARLFRAMSARRSCPDQRVSSLLWAPRVLFAVALLLFCVTLPGSCGASSLVRIKVPLLALGSRSRDLSRWLTSSDDSIG